MTAATEAEETEPSRSEANDLALRLARAHTQNKDVICLDGSVAFDCSVRENRKRTCFPEQRIPRALDKHH